MRWPGHKHGDRRWKEKFAYLPTNVHGIWFWMEPYWEYQVWVDGYFHDGWQCVYRRIYPDMDFPLRKGPIND